MPSNETCIKKLLGNLSSCNLFWSSFPQYTSSHLCQCVSPVILEWKEAGVVQTQTVNKSTTIGRDPVRCNVVLSHPTVSGLHAIIYFRDTDGLFYLRNLRDSNPPVVYNKRLVQGEAPLRQGSPIYLDQVMLTVTKPSAHSAQTEYGLKCPNLKCGCVSAYDSLKLVCPWCGTSLAAAPSVIMPPVRS